VQSLGDAFRAAWTLVVELDPDLIEIVGLSISVSGASLLIASAVGLPIGGLLALGRFPGRRALIVIVNALMGLPPVVVGLLVYLLLSRSGPLGELGWLFTARAMVLAQVVLITPIVAALSRQVLEDLWEEYAEQLSSLGASPMRAIPTLLWEGRFTLLTTVLAGFGRAIGEVGAVIVVGGNIAHATRVMTTAIALETRKGDLALALGLGIVLLALAVAINGLAGLARELGARWEGS
jgi:tungstate transport system permease protein